MGHTAHQAQRKGLSMKRPELTFEEFCELPIRYTTGISFDKGAMRMYRNEEHGVQLEVHTPRNPRTGKWGMGKRYWFLDFDSREFNTADQCYLAYMEHACGVTV